MASNPKVSSPTIGCQNFLVVTGFDWDGLDFSEQDLWAGADFADGVDTIGTGTIGSRLWSKPSINAIGVDMTSVD